jgi:arginyl-tRNA synthetase
MKEEIREAVHKSLDNLGFDIDHIGCTIEIEIPKKREFGDFSSNIALILAKNAGKNPREVAELIIQNLPDDAKNLFKRVEIAGAGFINFFVKELAIISKLTQIYRLGADYGFSTVGNGERVLIEFVSANPTGYLHMGHARNACVGDAISNLLNAIGYNVTREFFINDAGRQIELLGHSVYRSYEELFGIKNESLEDGYQGDYIKEIALKLKNEKGDALLADKSNKGDSIEFCKDYAKNILLDEIREDLELIGVSFDTWYSEREELYSPIRHKDNENLIDIILNKLDERGVIGHKDGATWFEASKFGDTQDWVLVKKDGSYTYFISDIAYHYDKIKRGFGKLINVWGADHHGHVSRIKAAMRALGFDDSYLRVVLIQFVRLLTEGKEASMSKRSGTYVTMRDVVKEVGRDVTRFFLLMRSSDSHLDFDLDLAKKQSSENPVYYIQYAHARIGSVFENALARKVHPSSDFLKLLDHPDEIDITSKLLQFPEVIMDSALSLSPHKIAFYLQNIASDFHVYYNKCRIIADSRELSGARLFFVHCIKTVLSNGLRLLGVGAPERM